jgi:hypothetical protein
MYKWSSSYPTSYPVGSSNYTWATGAFTNPATLNGWSQTIGTGTEGQVLYRVRAVYADTSTTATSAITWPTSPTVETVSNYASDGSDGVDGVNGTRTAILEVYKWASVTPTSFPSGTSIYTWSTGVFTAPTTANGWSINPGASTAGYTLYACQVKYADALTTTTSTVTWDTSTAYVVGAAGTNGTDGTAGTSYSIKSDASVIATKKDSTYNPSTITVKSRKSVGSAETAYDGIFIIKADNVTVYTSSANESEHTYTVISGTKSIEVNLYEAGGTSTLYDTKTIPVLQYDSTITVVLDDDYQGFQCESDGSISGSVSITSSVKIYRGEEELKCKIGELPGASGFSLSKNNNNVILTALSGSDMADSGKITIPVYLLDESTIKLIGDSATPWVIGDPATPWVIGDMDIDASSEYDAVFRYWKVYKGSDGGTYTISSSSDVFTKDRYGTVTPSTITVTAYNLSDAYNGRFKILTSTDGSSYTLQYTSSSNESMHTFTIPSGTLCLRIELYKYGGTVSKVCTVNYTITYNATAQYLGPVSTMPSSGIVSGDTVLWIGASGTYTPASVYRYNGSSWSILDYADTSNSGYYMEALSDILTNFATSSGYFNAVFCNAFFANSASITALQTKTITLTTSGVIKSANHVTNTAGLYIDYVGNADFNGNTHIGGTLTVDGIGNFGSNCAFSGLIKQGTSVYFDTYCELIYDSSPSLVFYTSNHNYTCSRTSTGMFNLSFTKPSACTVYMKPRVFFNNISINADNSIFIFGSDGGSGSDHAATLNFRDGNGVLTDPHVACFMIIWIASYA